MEVALVDALMLITIIAAYIFGCVVTNSAGGLHLRGIGNLARLARWVLPGVRPPGQPARTGGRERQGRLPV